MPARSPSPKHLTWCSRTSFVEDIVPVIDSAGGCFGGANRVGRHRLEERHHRAQPHADLFHELVLFRLTLLVEPGTALLVLRDPSFRVRSGPNLLEHPLHFLLRRVSDDARSSGIVA